MCNLPGEGSGACGGDSMPPLLPQAVLEAVAGAEDELSYLSH